MFVYGNYFYSFVFFDNAIVNDNFRRVTVNADFAHILSKIRKCHNIKKKILFDNAGFEKQPTKIERNEYKSFLQ